ncbi:MAG: UTP--glucose-1-phosphate uridylyltransferase GalU [Verrucomicrobia bacterium]|jgi:UTP--glucose-1-phosphate uridylyltransferase|nr:UTP--glucose-1-phosphate uridylyltransferase GalU [Verrucomicrobiota bacterium]
MKITKAVIPAAGFGTRFLPASKAQPKEMLPIVDTPTIQYVVEEVEKAGISDILMIIGKAKRAIEEHFDRNFELEAELAEKNRLQELNDIRRISEIANIFFIYQKELNGLGDAVNYARSHVGQEPFVVLLGDTIIDTDNSQSITAEMIRVYEQYQAPVVLLEEVDPKKVSRYGIVGGTMIDSQIVEINQLVEKPAVDQAPSNLAVAGRYILTPDIFECIDQTPRGKNNEIQLTDAMQLLLKRRRFYGLKLKGVRHDIGNKLDFVKTNILYAMKRRDMGEAVKKFIKEIAAKLEH